MARMVYYVLVWIVAHIGIHMHTLQRGKQHMGQVWSRSDNGVRRYFIALLFS